MSVLTFSPAMAVQDQDKAERPKVANNPSERVRGGGSGYVPSTGRNFTILKAGERLVSMLVVPTRTWKPSGRVLQC